MLILSSDREKADLIDGLFNIMVLYSAANYITPFFSSLWMHRQKFRLRDSAGKSKFIRRVNRTHAVKYRRQAATMLLQQIVCAYEIWQ